MLRRFRKLFEKKKKPSDYTTSPFFTERIERTDNFLSQFSLWVAGSGPSDTFRKWEEDGEFGHLFSIMKNPKANGFVVRSYPHEKYEFDFIMDHLKNKVLDFGYVLQSADRRFFEMDNAMRTIDRYYLKPKLRTEDFVDKRRQLYGNILIELEKVDQKPRNIRFLSTVFSDHKYHEPFPFDDLLDRLLV